MAHFYLKDGVRYYPGRRFTYGDINYTPQGSMDATFESLGFARVEIQGARPSDQYYIVTGPDDTGAYQATPRDLDELKAAEIARVKQDANTQLQGTDWLVVRAAEDPSKPVGTAITDYRAAVRTTSSDHEAAINACTTVEELAALAPVVWPTDPTAEPA